MFAKLSITGIGLKARATKISSDKEVQVNSDLLTVFGRKGKLTLDDPVGNPNADDDINDVGYAI